MTFADSMPLVNVFDLDSCVFLFLRKFFHHLSDAVMKISLKIYINVASKSCIAQVQFARFEPFFRLWHRVLIRPAPLGLAKYLTTLFITSPRVLIGKSHL